jgi:hypothetical protein
VTSTATLRIGAAAPVPALLRAAAAAAAAVLLLAAPSWGDVVGWTA